MIRIGIVGCGRILAAHLRGYQLLRQAGVDNFRITALCARRAADAQMYVRRGEGPPQRAPVSDTPGDPLAVGDIYLSDFQSDTDVQIYTDYRRMISDGPVDAVNDFTIHSLHHRIAQSAFAHGKHLLTQKPLAITVAAALQMCREADARELVLAVFENARNRSDTRQAGWLYRNGLAGRLQLMLMANVGNWWAPDLIVAETPWRHQRGEAGGITLDIGVHLLHHFRYVAGEIERVSGQASVLSPTRVTRDEQGRVVQQLECDADDTLLAHFTTAQGVQGQIAASWSGHAPGTRLAPGRGIVYHGSRGHLAGDELTLADGGRHSLAEAYAAECPAEEHQRHFPLGLQDAFALNQLDWLRAIEERREAETSGWEGLRDLAAAFAVLESSHAGTAVSVADVLDGTIDAFQRPLNEKFV